MKPHIARTVQRSAVATRFIDQEEIVMGFQYDFGWALEQLRMGARVCRQGWNGKNMWLVYQKAYPDGIPINQNTAEATGIPKGTLCKFLPYLMMRTADGSFVPWLASQTDILSYDWGYEPTYLKGPELEKKHGCAWLHTNQPCSLPDAVVTNEMVPEI